MKRQATYQPPFTCWRLPSVKVKPRKERPKRQPKSTLATRLKASQTSTTGEKTSSVVLPPSKVDGDAQSAVHFHQSVPVSPRAASPDPFGTLAGSGDETVENIGRWWFYSQDGRLNSRQFHPVKCYWVDTLWNLARSDETMFTCMVAFSRRKMSALTGTDVHHSDLMTKGRILELTSRRLRNTTAGSHDSLTFVAMSCLALLDMRDREFATAVKHLMALQSLITFEHINGRQWLYIVFVDLRFALLRGTLPLLSFHIPTEFRATPPECLMYRTEAHRCALRNARVVPLGEYLTFNHIFVNFRKLHELGLAWQELFGGPTPPFGTIYDLDYQLLTLSVNLRKTQALTGEDTTTSELVLGAMQLQAWIISRPWVPQKPVTYVSVLNRMRPLLVAHTNDLLTYWCARHDDPSCLLWILFTFGGIAHEFAEDMASLGISALAEILVHLGMKREMDLVDALRRWPWVEHWHKRMVPVIWQQIHTTGIDGSTGCGQKLDKSATERNSAVTPKQEHYFVGGFEFCSGLWNPA